MWKTDKKTWFSEEEYNQLLQTNSELKQELKKVQDDYYSMVDRFEDLNEKYKMAVNQNNTVYKINEQLQSEIKKIKCDGLDCDTCLEIDCPRR